MVYPVPKSVQELIPICRIAEDGIFQLENKPDGAEVLFDKAYLFADTNFAPMDEYEKEEFLKLLCLTFNSLNVSWKFLVMNLNRDMEQVKKEVYIADQDPRYSKLVSSFNDHMEHAMLKGRSGIEQIRIFLLTCKRQNVEQARDFFRSIEANLSVNFKRLQSGLTPLDATGRLKYLHAFYRMGNEAKFDFDFHRSLRRGADWRDAIAPHIVKHYQDEYGTFDGQTLQIDERYVRALYVPQFPNSINPDILQKLTAGNYHVIITCDVASIPQEVTRKRLNDLYMQNGRAIEKQQQARNKAQAWSSDITYDRRREKEELENYLDILNENDEKMFYVGLYAVLSAPTKQQLDNDTVSFCATAQGEGFVFKPAVFEQIETVNTALPIGCRFCTNMQPLFTQPLCGLTPFIVHELYQPGGNFYGINQISKNVLIGNRKTLKNGNGFVIGETGGGKSVDAKSEIVQVYCNTQDDIIIIDPQNEYGDIAKYLDGQFIAFGANAEHYINPLDTDNYSYMSSKRAFLADKTELMLGILSQILVDDITGHDKSLVSRCIQQIYEDLGKHGFKTPTLLDFYHTLEEQPEIQAKEMKLAMELFVTGTLDMFAKPTNVNTKNRLTVYGIADLGAEQSGVGMLIMLESIRSRIAANAKKGKATWLYIDEFHNLAGQEYSARFLEKIWKEVRKLGGLCTAITQNIADLLVTKMVETMLCNSEYMSILTQTELEIGILHNTLGISENLLRYVRNADTGCGLLKFGEKYIPKDARLPKDSEMYRLFNTNFHEIQEMKNRKKLLEQEQKRMPELVKQVMEEQPLSTEDTDTAGGSDGTA